MLNYIIYGSIQGCIVNNGFSPNPDSSILGKHPLCPCTEFHKVAYNFHICMHGNYISGKWPYTGQNRELCLRAYMRLPWQGHYSNYLQ